MTGLALPHVAVLLLAVGCATVAPPRPHIIEIETTRFDGVHYPMPRALPFAAQPPPSPPPPEDPRLASAIEVPQVPAVPVVLPDLRNAAVRDNETERLSRQYLHWVEQTYRVVRQLSLGGALTDPLVLRKWHADSVSDMAGLIERAAALEGAFVDLAQETATDLAGSLQEPGRAGRLRTLFRMSACVRRDLAERSRDALDYLDARRGGMDDASLRAALVASPATIEQRTDELIRQTSATLACAQLAGQALGGR